MNNRVTERRTRRALARRGLSLQGSKRRDPGAETFGLYRVVRGEEIVLDWTALESIEDFIRVSREIATAAHAAMAHAQHPAAFTPTATANTPQASTRRTPRTATRASR